MFLLDLIFLKFLKNQMYLKYLSFHLNQMYLKNRQNLNNLLPLKYH
jgi:hypothetical protein